VSRKSDDKSSSEAEAEIEVPTKQQPPMAGGVIFMKEEERNHLMQAVTDIKLLQDPTYTASLEYILKQYNLTLAKFHEAISSSDEQFFAKIMVRGNGS